MNALTVVLTSTTKTTDIIDEYRFKYDTLILSGYYSYCDTSNHKYSIDLVIGGNSPIPTDTFNLHPLSRSFTELKQDVRDLNRIKTIKQKLQEEYPNKNFFNDYSSEILSFFDNTELNDIDSEVIHYFNGTYYLSAQSSSMHYSTGYGDSSLFRISGFRVRRIEPPKINWDILKKYTQV